jgi:hypothetical protein
MLDDRKLVVDDWLLYWLFIDDHKRQLGFTTDANKWLIIINDNLMIDDWGSMTIEGW